jgi:hypothetical protein
LALWFFGVKLKNLVGITTRQKKQQFKIVKEKQEMTKEQIWDLLEIYRLLQNATNKSDQHEGFELLHTFIEENLFKTEGEN